MTNVEKLNAEYREILKQKKILRDEEKVLEEQILKGLNAGLGVKSERERLSEIDKEYQNLCIRHGEVVDSLLSIVCPDSD